MTYLFQNSGFAADSSRNHFTLQYGLKDLEHESIEDILPETLTGGTVSFVRYDMDELDRSKVDNTVKRAQLSLKIPTAAEFENLRVGDSYNDYVKERVIKFFNDFNTTDKNGIHLKNSSLYVPITADVENFALTDSEIRSDLNFDPETKVEFKNSKLVNCKVLTEDPDKTNYPVLINDALIYNGEFEDVTYLDNVTVLNINKLELHNANMKDVDVIRTVDQTKSLAKIISFDTDVSDLKHDMFKEDKEPMGRLIYDNGQVTKQATYTNEYETRQNHAHLLSQYEPIQEMQGRLHDLPKPSTPSKSEPDFGL